MNFEERFKNRAVYVTRDGLHKSILEQTNLAVNHIKRSSPPDDAAFTRKAINQQLGLEAAPQQQEEDEANELWAEDLGVQNYIYPQQKRQQPEGSLPYHRQSLRNPQQSSHQDLNQPSSMQGPGIGVQPSKNPQIPRQMSMDALYGARKVPQKQPEKLLTAKEFLNNYNGGKHANLLQSNHASHANQFYQEQLQQFKQPNYPQHQQQQHFPQQQPQSQNGNYTQNYRHENQFEPQQQGIFEHGVNARDIPPDHESQDPSSNNNYDENQQEYGQEMMNQPPKSRDYHNEFGGPEQHQNAQMRRHHSMGEMPSNNASFSDSNYHGKGYQQIYQEKLHSIKHNISQEIEFKPTKPVSPKFYTKQRAEERAEIKRMKDSIELSHTKTRTRRPKPADESIHDHHQLHVELPKPFDRGSHLLCVGDEYLNDISPKHQEFYVKNFNVDPKQFIEPTSILEQYAVPPSQGRYNEDPRFSQLDEQQRKNLPSPMKHYSNRRQPSPRGNNNKVVFHDATPQTDRKNGQQQRYLTPQPSRSIEFRPYTLKEYKTFQENSGVKRRFGGLGKNTGGEEWQKKFEVLNRMKNFGLNANVNNMERLPAVSQRSQEKSKSAERSISKPGELRKKALEFAKQIPLPEPKKLYRYSSENEYADSKNGLDNADDINSRNLELFERRRQIYKESLQKIK